MYYIGELTVFLSLQDGCTALHLAAQEGKVDVVRLLTESQAEVNIQTEVQHIPTLCHIMSNYCWPVVYCMVSLSPTSHS